MTENEYKQRIEQLEREVSDLKAKLTAKQKTTRYGLVWEDVPEAFERDTENRIPILEEVKDKAIKNSDGKPTHILIEGDNYHALQCLNYTHRGKVDVIYIDPPYNTGKEFVYKDKRTLDKFPDGQTIDTNHPLRHSAWLSFMSKRLELAKNLLSEKGVIFISIDDNEQANLKLLCDKVFGEIRCVGTFCWVRKKKGSNLSKEFRKTTEYVHCFKNINNSIELFGEKAYSDKLVPLLNRANKVSTLYFKANTTYVGNDVSVKIIKAGCYGEGELSITLSNDIIVGDNNVIISDYSIIGRFRWAQTTVNEEIQNGSIFYLSKSLRINVARYNQGDKFKAIASLLGVNDSIGTNEDATQELRDIFSEQENIPFDFPKPISLIKYLLNSVVAENHNALILDFFAGSGTTLHATMKLNAEDGGKRQCILVQQKEGDKNICESVTYERNRRVMCGYTNAKGEQVAGLGGQLKYYRTSFVGKNASRNATDQDRAELSLKAGYLLALGENTLNELLHTSAYQLFTDGAEKFTAVYFIGNLDNFADFVAEIEHVQSTHENPQIATYIFCWGAVETFENEFDNLKGITLKAIPQPILDIYKSINA